MAPDRLIRAIPFVLLVVSSCAQESASSCTEVRESADPSSGLHVVDVESVSYETLPPTSGPHVAVAPPSGVLDEPIPEPIQVTILEAGLALIQWQDLSGVDVVELEELAGSDVVVAPGSDLPSPVVVTAWTWKLTCSEIDVSAIGAFTSTRPRGAPGPDR